ncbi:type II toxin-antitoxin system VapC family toxin [cf. Phormidesmis sp. LEGE 11477]|uniref:type II toxin-antitoxin system VapC family toxin n=1 Tax=cf. Phormidesmis sp. LEGE 11477 TaxID=1828680 RepID=UPI00188265FA|nr:PIN domain-containing protein [cf. Phormidesmis sp. LEGE 11477]MBE9062453.1 PIN domain-containing protein [cf. Phormidesmis sp. LEGE 11477]
MDTNILIWGIKRQASSGQENMILKARHLIRTLEEDRINVIIPSLVLAELLMPIESRDYGDFLAKMNKRFMIAPFDTQAAMHYATLWKQWREQTTQSSSEKQTQPTRTKMKTDFMIVATAISRKAECIYSQDTDIIKFSKGHVDVRGLPPVFHQGSLI